MFTKYNVVGGIAIAAIVASLLIVTWQGSSGGEGTNAASLRHLKGVSADRQE